MFLKFHVKSLGEIIYYYVDCHQYADDSQLYISLSRSSSVAVQALNQSPPAVIKRLRGTNWKLNPDKKVVILKSWRTQWFPLLMWSRGHLFKSLGIILDPPLLLECNWEKPHSSILILLRNGHLPCLCYSGHMDPCNGYFYYNALYMYLPLKWIWKLQLAQS